MWASVEVGLAGAGCECGVCWSSSSLPSPAVKRALTTSVESCRPLEAAVGLLECVHT